MTFEETRDYLRGEDRFATVSCPFAVGIGLRGRFVNFIESLKNDPRFQDVDISLTNYGGFITRMYKLVVDGHTDKIIEVLDEVEDFYAMWGDS